MDWTKEHRPCRAERPVDQVGEERSGGPRGLITVRQPSREGLLSKRSDLHFLEKHISSRNRSISCNTKCGTELFLIFISIFHSLLRKAIAVYYSRWLNLPSLTRWRQRSSSLTSDIRLDLPAGRDTNAYITSHTPLARGERRCDDGLAGFIAHRSAVGDP